MFKKTPLFKYTQYLMILFFLCGGVFQDISAQEPRAAQLYNKAQELIKEYEYFEAIDLLRQALQINPYFFDAKTLLADSYFQLKNYSTAWDLYIELEKVEPNNVSLLVKLANTKIALSNNPNDMVGATYYLNKAFKLQPQNPSVIASFGSYYYAIGNLKKAMDYYNLLGPDPRNIIIHLNKAKVYEQWGNNQNWLQELKNAELLESNNFEVLMALSNYYASQGDFDSTKEYLTMAQRVNPNSMDVLLSFAQLFLNQKDYESAIPYLSKILTKDKTNSLLYYYMAVAYEALGDYIKSLEVLKTGMQYDFGNEFLRVKAEEIAINHFPLGSPEREKLSSYYTYNIPSVSAGAINTGSLFFLNRSLRINPLSLPMRLKLAQYYRQRGFIYEYLKILRTGLFLDPQNEKLDNEIKLNKRFVASTLESKENIAPFSPFEVKPVYSIGETIIQNTSTYLYFSQEFKQLLLEALSTTKRINAFIKGKEDSTKMPDFELRLVLNPDYNKIALQAEVIYLKTGAILHTYQFNEYGNNKLYNSVLALANQLIKDSPVVGKVIKIQGNNAIISLGAMQNIKQGDEVLILKDPNISFSLFQNKALSKSQQSELGLASGKVLELGENIAKVSFTPLESIIFNLVQPNQNVLMMPKEIKK